MQIIKVQDYQAMSEKLLELFVSRITENPDCVLSFTTGATPEGLLKLLAARVNAGLDISNCTFCNLDEYVGKRDGKYSVHSFMHRYFYDVVNKHPKNIFMLNAEAADQAAEVQRYAAILDSYPRDIQLLGLGTNGHVGANEPGTPFDSSLFVADSHESTIQATKNLFDLSYEETPRQMYTMGFREIMAADCVILAASGSKKAEAVQKVIEGGISTDIPASFLKTHPNFIFIIDEAAAALLQR